MFSTYVWPYNLIPPQIGQFSIYSPTMVNITYPEMAQTIIPINLSSVVQVTQQKKFKIVERKKFIQKQDKIHENINERRILDRKRSSENIDEYTSKFQNSQRNLLSNLLHHLVSFILKNPQFKQIMQKIIAIHHLNVTIFDVIQFVSKIKLRSYIKVTTIQDLWSRNNQNKELSKALRIFSYYFLKQKSYLLVCDSRRIKSGTKIQHLMKIRSLIRLLFLS